MPVNLMSKLKNLSVKSQTLNKEFKYNILFTQSVFRLQIGPQAEEPTPDTL